MFIVNQAVWPHKLTGIILSSNNRKISSFMRTSTIVLWIRKASPFIVHSRLESQPNMEAFWIIFISGICVAITQIIISTSDLIDPDQSKKWPSNIKLKGWIFYGLTIVLGVSPAIQYGIQENAHTKKESANAIAQEERDNRLTSIVTETLGKYGYKLDSTNNVLINIQDSVAAIKPVIMAPEPDPPIFTISTDKNLPGIVIVDTSQDKYDINFTFVSLGEGCTNFQVENDFVVEDSNGNLTYIRFQTPFKLLDKNVTISNNGYHLGSGLNIFKPLDIQMLYVWIRGTFTRLNGSGSFRIDKLFLLKRKDNTIGYYDRERPKRQEVIDFIKQNL